MPSWMWICWNTTSVAWKESNVSDREREEIEKAYADGMDRLRDDLVDRGEREQWTNQQKEVALSLYDELVNLVLDHELA